MSSDYSGSSSPSLIDISIRIDDEIIPYIPSSPSQSMIFIDILEGLEDGLMSSSKQRSIIFCGMMDDDLGFVLMDALRPFKEIAVRSFTVFIDDLFFRSGFKEIFSRYSSLIRFQIFVIIGLEFIFLLLFTKGIPFGFGHCGISSRFISASFRTGDDFDAWKTP